MTSGTILPSIGPPPPEFRRSFVPEHLRPKSLGQTAQDQPAPEPVVRPEQKAAPEQQNSEAERPPAERQAPSSLVTLGGASAVAVQVQEDSLRQQQASSVRQEKQPLADELTDEELSEVQRLKDRDREVRAHEAAHASTGRGFTGSPSYEYATGPDGVRYAVGGHVDIDVSAVPDDPRATISKMEVIQAAALAPARPSGQDRAVAAAAAAKAREAQAELSKQEKEALVEETSDGAAGATFAGAKAANGSSSFGSDPSANEEGAFAATGLRPTVTEPISINLVV